MKHVVWGVALGAFLCACGGSDGGGVSGEGASSAPESSSSAPESASASPSETAVSDRDDDGVYDGVDEYPDNPWASQVEELLVECEVRGGTVQFVVDRVEPNWKRVWKEPLPEGRNGAWCESYGDFRLDPAVSPVEQALLDRVKKHTKYTLRTPYEYCVEHGTRFTRTMWPAGPDQVPEAQATLLLCPDHPDAASIRSRIADVGVLETQIAEGRAFDDGNYRVGAGVQPGTYVSTDVSNCYWERLDDAGSIIDNSFVIDALRVEVTVSATDFSFHTENCGTWRPAG